MSPPPAPLESHTSETDEQNQDRISVNDIYAGEANNAADQPTPSTETDDIPSPDDSVIGSKLDGELDGEDDGGDDGGDGGRGSGRRRNKRRQIDSWVPPPLPITADVRYTNYEGFKNFYDTKQASYAIHVLQAGYDIKDEANKERQNRGVARLYDLNAKTSIRLYNITDEIWIQRVRIHSQYILAHFRTVTGNNALVWEMPRTFFRPFHAFIHFQAKMKEALEDTRKKLADKLATQESGHKPEGKKAAGTGGMSPMKKLSPSKDLSPSPTKRKSAKARRGSLSDSSGSESESDSGSDSDSDADNAIPDDVLVCQEAVDHLKCYVDFVDEKIMPLKDMFKGTSKKHIRYSDLTYLFHPGNVVYSPAQSETAAKTSSSVYQPVWKVQYINPPSIHGIQCEEYDPSHRFFISCFYIDFDSKAYGPVKHRFEVAPYEGEIDIKNLPVYPIRYRTSFAKGLGVQGQDRLRLAGKDFQFYVQERHLYYRGWTLTTSPNGDTLTSSTGEPMTHPEHVDSGVIVDFKAALQAIPSWRPMFKEPSSLDEHWTVREDKFPEIQWPDSKRVKSVSRSTSFLQVRDAAHAIETARYTSSDPFWVAYAADITDESYELTEDDLQLLPSRVMGYVLRDRKFVQLDVHLLRKIDPQENAFDSLKIDAEHKEMVMALVDSHFRKKAIKDPHHYSLGQDLIQGKGEGLVILLHGVPGVGKTATAEAVAQFKKQPLFVITCGDLGFTPKEVERSLEEIFRLAHMWDCILLLDEADIFLAERTRNDLKHNALVSVFLRVLEYHSGILFLTTNRVGTLDEAFKSRIHMSLYYPPLNEDQTLQIFEMNISRIEKIDHQRHHTRLPAPKEGKEGKEGKGKEIRDASSTRENEDKESDKVEHAKPKKHDDKSELPHHLIVDRRSVMEFAKCHYNDLDQYPWNGRQIRNAFQIASSLAFYDKRREWVGKRREDETAVIEAAVLSADQFKKVAVATKRFEDYMKEARGVDDGIYALAERLRADGHVARDQEYPPRTPRSGRGDRHARDLQVGSHHGRQFGRPPSPPPFRTPQSMGRKADDFDRRRSDGRYYDDRDDTGSMYNGRDDYRGGGGRGGGQDLRRRNDSGQRYGYSSDWRDDYNERGDYRGDYRDAYRDEYRDDYSGGGQGQNRERGTPRDDYNDGGQGQNRGRGTPSRGTPSRGTPSGRDGGHDGGHDGHDSGRGQRREREVRGGTAVAESWT